MASTWSWITVLPSSVRGAYWLVMRLNFPAVISVVFRPAFSSAALTSVWVATTPMLPTCVVSPAMRIWSAAAAIQ